MSLEQPDHRVAQRRGEFGTPQQPGADSRVPWLPAGPGPVGQPVNPVDWFRRMPGGSTAFVRPAEDDASVTKTEQ